ncbi:hypothetical protein NPIL_158521 [Nephila pilipes]|uniref:Uncharacterized protein n=1 Tax=Nephila pilipes TaxID=299642 RepID=A0A8X6P7Z8_NEPPI|nr:hypothetical protein NPIL_448461 [Nephila pilipes]GFU46449.1 hypothetical protein NPIL_158521 [Nephila pilipes]
MASNFRAKCIVKRLVDLIVQGIVLFYSLDTLKDKSQQFVPCTPYGNSMGKRRTGQSWRKNGCLKSWVSMVLLMPCEKIIYQIIINNKSGAATIDLTSLFLYSSVSSLTAVVQILKSIQGTPSRTSNAFASLRFNHEV